MKKKFMRKNAQIDLGLLILRLVTGGLMLPHGIAKLVNGHDKIKLMLTSKGLPELLWIGVPFTEILAPICLMLGVFSRISGLLIAAVMLVAMYMAMGWEAFTFTKTGGVKSELNLLFLFNGIILYLTGPGNYILLKSSKRILQ